MTVLCLGQARAVSAAAQAWPRQPNGAVAGDAQVALAVESAAQVARLAENIHRTAWDQLCRGGLADPQAEGKRLREVLDQARECVRQVLDLFAGANGQASGRTDLAPLARAHEVLDRLDERFRDGWPYADPEEIATARQRHDAGDYLRFEDLARELGAED
jgi:hypothetical protein